MIPKHAKNKRVKETGSTPRRNVSKTSDNTPYLVSRNVASEAISFLILSAIKSREQILRPSVSYPFSKYDFFSSGCKKRYYFGATVYFVVEKLFQNWLPDNFWSTESVLLLNSLSIAWVGTIRLPREKNSRNGTLHEILLSTTKLFLVRCSTMIVTILRIRPCNSFKIESIFSSRTGRRTTFFLRIAVENFHSDETYCLQIANRNP